MSNSNTSEIKFTVELDKNKIPESLKWTAQDGGVQDEAAKAIMLSIWDSERKNRFELIYGLKTCLLMK